MYEPYQQRVVDEKAELDEKLVNLTVFIVGKIFPTLTYQEQIRLRRQLNAMHNYSEVLGERIEAFWVLSEPVAGCE